MNTLVRYATVLALVLSTLVVVLICGEGLCESCAHSCVCRVDRADRFKRTVARILGRLALGARLVVWAPRAVWIAPIGSGRLLQPPSSLTPVPLLI